jgi:membrane protein YqaA with SNARE-associated domain
MDTFLVDWGLPALFGISFLAATVLPIASEWLLAALVIRQGTLAAPVVVATLGNTLGAVTTWGVGFWGGAVILHRWLGISPADRARAENWYGRWGSWSLLMAWMPVVGDPLCRSWPGPRGGSHFRSCPSINGVLGLRPAFSRPGYPR